MKSLSHVRLFETPWTVAYETPPPMGFSRQEYWSGLPLPSPGDLPNPGQKRVQFGRDFWYTIRRILATNWRWAAKEGERSGTILVFLAWILNISGAAIRDQEDWRSSQFVQMIGGGRRADNGL